MGYGAGGGLWGIFVAYLLQFHGIIDLRVPRGGVDFFEERQLEFAMRRFVLSFAIFGICWVGGAGV